METRYVCEECGVEVTVMTDGGVVRNCEHEDAVITVNLSANAKIRSLLGDTKTKRVS